MIDIPFCGVAPLPGGVAWTFEPAVMLALAALAAVGSRITREGVPAWSMALGWTILALALVSPLCSLAVALFSTRVAQHMLIVLVAAPLLALGVARPARLARLGSGLPAAVFAVMLWVWHLPAPYAATFATDGIAWGAMHVTLLGSATWLWLALFAGLRHAPHLAIGSGVATAMQMGVLGALLTFAPRPLYAVHTPGMTAPWGLSPLEDQQLGGLLMWVPGGLLFAAVMVAAIAMLLRASAAEPARPGLHALLVLLALGAAPAALAQGNDATTSSSAPSEAGQRAAPVGVLTTSSVTTGSSGPRQPAPASPPGADRRTRVLGPVCAGLAEGPLADCRAKSGM